MMYELRDIGFSTGVGIGGDPVIGTTHIDCLQAFQDDPETDAIVMIGEIGGDAEERAAAYIKDNVTKPVVGYVAGFTAPEGKTMGHAGAIVSGSSGTAAAKQEALEAVGVKVGKTPSETARLMREHHAEPPGLTSLPRLTEGSSPTSSAATSPTRRVGDTPTDDVGTRARGEEGRRGGGSLGEVCRRRPGVARTPPSASRAHWTR